MELDLNISYASWVYEYGLQFPYGDCQCGCGKKTEISHVTRSGRGWKKGEPKRFYKSGHSLSPKTFKDAFEKYVIPGSPNECWIWKNSNGRYGKVKIHGK